jgi:hypothetical protein
VASKKEKDKRNFWDIGRSGAGVVAGRGGWKRSEWGREFEGLDRWGHAGQVERKDGG